MIRPLQINLKSSPGFGPGRQTSLFNRFRFPPACAVGESRILFRDLAADPCSPRPADRFAQRCWTTVSDRMSVSLGQVSLQQVCLPVGSGWSASDCADPEVPIGSVFPTADIRRSRRNVAVSGKPRFVDKAWTLFSSVFCDFCCFSLFSPCLHVVVKAVIYAVKRNSTQQEERCTAPELTRKTTKE